MIEQKIGSVTIKQHMDIDEIPIKVYNLFNEYAILESDIGSDIGSVDQNFRKLHSYIMTKKFEEAAGEANNLHQSFWNIFQHNNFRGLQYAVMIAEVNGVPVTDKTEANLKKIIDQLSDEGLTMMMMKTYLQEVKKKFLSN